MYNKFGSDTMVAQVLVGLKTAHIDQTFSYIVPNFILDKISIRFLNILNVVQK